MSIRRIALCVALVMAGGFSCAPRSQPLAPTTPISDRSQTPIPAASPQPSAQVQSQQQQQQQQQLSNTTATNDVIATVGDATITRQQLEKPLMEAYGLNILAKVAQLELARVEARSMGLNITDEDVKAET